MEEFFNKLLDLSIWIPSTFVTSLVGGALWLARNTIKTRLTNAVKHEYDTKLKGLESRLRKSEDNFRSELDEKSSQISALRDGALNGIAQRQTTLFNKRIEALDIIWSTVVKARRFQLASSLLTGIKVDEAFKAIAENPRYAEPFKMMSQNSSPNDLMFLNEAYEVRPHVSILVWAYYAAYEAIITKGVITLHALQTGMPQNLMADDTKLKSLLKSALPEIKNFDENFNASFSHVYLELIENKLLEAIKYDLRGADIDESSVFLANSVIKSAAELKKGEE